MHRRTVTSRRLLPVLLALSLQAPVFASAIEWLELPPDIAGETPWLRQDGNGLSLSWVTRLDGKFTLRASHFDSAGWRPAGIVASGEHWYNSAADFARVLPMGDGRLLAVWLEFTSFRDFHYRFAAAHSLDGGASWQAVDNHPGIEDHGYHGFVSAFGDDDGFVLFWISGFGDDAGLWRGRLGKDGQWSPAERIDARVCNCCLTAVSPMRTLVYRDRDAAEIRDIALLESAASANAGRPLHADGWRIRACPKNGPAISENRQWRAVAWFTDAEDGAETRLMIMPSEASAANRVIDVAGGRSRGQVDLTWIGESRLALSTLTRDNGIEIYLIEVDGSGAGKQRKIAIPNTNDAGQATLAYFDGSLYAAFYDRAERQIRLARIDPGA